MFAIPLKRSVLVGLVTLTALLAALLVGPGVGAQSTGYQQVSAGWYHTCALSLDGTVFCWGRQAEGQTNAPGGAFVEVSAGGFHTCGLRPDGHAECWGSNDLGQECFSWGCLPIYGGQIDAPKDVLFSQVSAGVLHTCGLTRDGNIDCWGDNRHGEATDQTGPYTEVRAGDEHTCGLRSNGTVDCYGDSTKGRANDEMGAFTGLSVGGSHNCAVRSSDHTLCCWGAGTTKTGIAPQYGQSMPPSGAFMEVSAGNLHTCGLRNDGRLTSWGYNFYGQVGKTPDGFFNQVDAGQGHTCALSETGAVVCWGRNDYHQASMPGLGGPITIFDFEGFYPPVEAEPMLDEVTAGSALPIKFSLGGDQGLDVIAPDYPASQPLDCVTLDPGGERAPVRSAGGSGLSYDPARDQYTYVWKTDKAWAGTCRLLALQLADGTEHLAAFKFK